MKARTARSVSSFSAWMFGLATSVLLLSVWGRAVVVDTDELSSNLRPMSESEQVTTLFVDWMTDQLVQSGVPEEQAETATELSLTTPAVESALGNVVEQVVLAAASPGPSEVTVDVASLMAPTIPAVTDAIVSAGVPATREQVGAVVTGLDPLVIREAGEPARIGPASPLAARLGLATVLAIGVQIVFGAIYVLVSPGRVGAVRTLFTRFAVGALSFAVLLRLGSWVLDPQGGRAPVSEALSLVAESKWFLPAIIGTCAGIAATIAWLAKLGSAQAARSSVRRVAEPRPTSGATTRLPG